MRNVIKFLHNYCKFPTNVKSEKTIVVDIKVVHYNELSLKEIREDTKYITEFKSAGGENIPGYSSLPKTKLIIVKLNTNGHIWAIMRRWTEKKEQYYKSLIGKEVLITITKT